MLTVQDKKLFFDESDKLLGNLGDSSALALAELVAQAKTLDCGKGFAKRVEVAEEVRRVNRYAPTANVSAALDQDVVMKSVPDNGSGRVSHRRKLASEIWCVV